MGLRVVGPGEGTRRGPLTPARCPSPALTFIVCVLALAWATTAGLLDPGTITLGLAAVLRVVLTLRWAASL